MAQSLNYGVPDYVLDKYLYSRKRRFAFESNKCC